MIRWKDIMNRFDLEKQITQVWNISDDIHQVREHFEPDDGLDNALLGIKTMLDIKCEKLFHIYEKLVEEKKI